MQSVQMSSADEPSQFINPLGGLQSTSPQTMVHKIDDITRSDNLGDEANQTSAHNKRARISEDEDHDTLPGVHLKDPHRNINYNGDSMSKDNGEVPHIGSDVAAVIEDLVEQTSKVQDLKSPERSECDKSLFPSDCSVLGQNHTDFNSVIGLSRQWSNR